jgi:hypothetical protein
MMEIGGTDIVFQVRSVAGGTPQERVMRFFQHWWPAGVVESDGTAEPVPLADRSGCELLLESSELVFYP